ncbi:hypothetical protein BDZ85DRAFT_248319 [Elsinoe ampelina]|uniref:Uncharacterized protein n=1 Tax=Elsinoe ampelina TaxID=302913 RepID=A0A6A6GGP9_9PEZI|nr:hypothetical protein BDZ85DRAFT_248319 [Elsinoe ampelina]
MAPRQSVTMPFAADTYPAKGSRKTRSVDILRQLLPAGQVPIQPQPNQIVSFRRDPELIADDFGTVVYVLMRQRYRESANLDDLEPGVRTHTHQDLVSALWEKSSNTDWKPRYLVGCIVEVFPLTRAKKASSQITARSRQLWALIAKFVNQLILELFPVVGSKAVVVADLMRDEFCHDAKEFIVADPSTDISHVGLVLANCESPFSALARILGKESVLLALAYNALPLLDTQSDITQADLQVISSIFIHHNTHSHFAAGLLYRHVLLQPGQITFHRQLDTHNECTILHADNANFTAHSYYLNGDIPFQASEYEAVTDASTRPPLPKEFAEHLRQGLLARGLESVIGVVPYGEDPGVTEYETLLPDDRTDGVKTRARVGGLIEEDVSTSWVFAEQDNGLVGIREAKKCVLLINGVHEVHKD